MLKSKELCHFISLNKYLSLKEFLSLTSQKKSNKLRLNKSKSYQLDKKL